MSMRVTAGSQGDRSISPLATAPSKVTFGHTIQQLKEGVSGLKAEQGLWQRIKNAVQGRGFTDPSVMKKQATTVKEVQFAYTQLLNIPRNSRDDQLFVIKCIRDLKSILKELKGIDKDSKITSFRIAHVEEGLDEIGKKIIAKKPIQGNAQAARTTGVAAEKRGAYFTAEKFYKKGAEMGDSESMLKLSLLLMKDWKHASMQDAINWARKAAHKGNVGAMIHLGNLMNLVAKRSSTATLETRGTDLTDEASKAEAFHWYLEAAKLGHVGAMEHVAKCYREGNGVKSNISEALTWESKALLTPFQKR